MKNYKELVRKIVDDDNVISIYEEMLPIFYENGLYIEYCGLLEKICHINKDSNIYIIMGNVISDFLNNTDAAAKAYNKYLSIVQPKLFLRFQQIAKEYNYTKLIYEEDSEDEKLIYLTDKYSVVIYIMIYLHQKKKINEIIELVPFLKQIKAQIDNYLAENPNINLCTLENIENSSFYLSSLLSQIEHHNDINKFAIELNPVNSDSYINILDDLVTYNNYDDALNFYKNEYCNIFPNSKKLENIINLCWFLSDEYSAQGKFFESVTFQKKAIDLELSNS